MRSFSKHLLSVLCGWDAQMITPVNYDQKLFDDCMKIMIDILYV